MNHDLRRLQHAAALAEIDQELLDLERDSSIPAGRKVVLLGYARHRREKKVLEIELVRIGEQVKECERQFDYSKTPQAQKQWRDREMMRLAGAALDAGTPRRYEGRRYKSAEGRGPEDETLRKLNAAKANYVAAKSRLDELRKKDLDFQSLTTEQPQQTKQADSEPARNPESDRVRKLAPGVAQFSPSLVDMNVPVGTSLKKMRRGLLKLGASSRKLKDPRILDAADHKIAHPECTYNAVSMRFFSTPKRADSIRSWVNKRKSSGGEE